MNGNPESTSDIIVKLDSCMTETCYPLLQQGVRIKVDTGSSVERLLCDTIGVSREYIEEKVQTIFLDGKAVDDLATTVLVEGSRIALSAAMPGLAGALMRRGGFFASMRSGISYHPEEAVAVAEPCFVTVLIFNMLVREMAPQFLAHGVWVTGEELAKFLSGLPREVLESFVAIRTEGNALDLPKLFSNQLLPPNTLVSIKIPQSQ